ncbi:hypothetical protein P4G95_08945 [Burkholderia vietnamiensis]|uniref:hypothetical protein n=1 Tax=Burkholderia vietnamiensis TaxID=60552 RepID=UPI00159363B9|nr:hypothetical protein [Burkholderia vietnamiensis]WHU91004.1 hypothetical protein P4G95_08945 [Burkholderia vietnamiensis]
MNKTLTAAERDAIERAISEVELCCQFDLADELRAILAAHPSQPEPRCLSVAAYDEAREFLYGNLESIRSAIDLADATGNCSQARGLEAVEYQIQRLFSAQPEPRAEVADDDKVCAEMYRWLRDNVGKWECVSSPDSWTRKSTGEVFHPKCLFSAFGTRYGGFMFEDAIKAARAGDPS